MRARSKGKGFAPSGETAERAPMALRALTFAALLYDRVLRSDERCVGPAEWRTWTEDMAEARGELERAALEYAAAVMRGE